MATADARTKERKQNIKKREDTSALSLYIIIVLANEDKHIEFHEVFKREKYIIDLR